jgi:N-acetylmuramoyl-L-alanine amidase
MKEAINLLTSKIRKVSCHFLINKKGKIFKLVNLEKRAWHAGESNWKKKNDINSRSIGIELVYEGELSNKRFPITQINSLIKLLYFLKKEYQIKEILGHSDIAPLRKIDPGKNFPWNNVLSKLKMNVSHTRINNKKMNKKEYLLFLTKLRKLGYGYISSNKKNEINSLVIDAFHRRYIPNLLGKELQHTSLNMVDDLLNLKDID